jgi:chloride channel protein, CIC family
VLLLSDLWHKVSRSLSGYSPLGKLGDFTLTSRTCVIALMAIFIGVCSAFVAFILLRLIGLITNLAFYQRWDFSLSSPAGNDLGIFVVLVPAIGSLIVGLMARYGTERIRGHGIPEALEAILVNGSRVGPNVALLKPLASAIAIGTGGPFGAEGPIIMTGGAIGSVTAQLFHLTSAERKTLLVAGAAGGMAAIFNTPIAATLLAVELMLFEWKPRSLIPVALASVTATIVRSYLPGLGSGALFATPLHAPVWQIGPLFFCLLAGLLAGLLAIVLTLAVYASEDLFHKLPIHWMWWPCIGGIFVGIGGFIYPPALGVGYDLIHQLLLGDFTLQMILGLLLVKSLIWAISLGSGNSGGVLAPVLLIGGALGGLESLLFPQIFPGFWPLVSMIATLGAVIGSPLTVIVFAVELTRDVTTFLPLLLTTIVAYGVVALVMRRSILTEKISRHGFHVSREYAIDPLEILFVRELMHTSIVALNSTITKSDLYALLHHTQKDEATPALSGSAQRLYPVLDGKKRMLGVVTSQDLAKFSLETDNPQDSVGQFSSTYELASAIRARPVVTYPDEPLRSALGRMAESGFTRLPVVDRNQPDQLLGLLSLQDLLTAMDRNINDERRRERVLNLRLLFPPRRIRQIEP